MYGPAKGRLLWSHGQACVKLAVATTDFNLDLELQHQVRTTVVDFLGLPGCLGA